MMREPRHQRSLGARLKGLAATLWDAPAVPSAVADKPASATPTSKHAKPADPVYVAARWGEKHDGVALFVDDDRRTRYLCRGALLQKSVLPQMSAIPALAASKVDRVLMAFAVPFSGASDSEAVIY